MEKTILSYIKVTTPLLMLTAIVNLYLIKINDNFSIWYRLLNMEGVIVGALLVGFTHFLGLFSFYKEKFHFERVTFIISAFLITLFIVKRDIIMLNPGKVMIDYIAFKFGIMGAVIFSIPFLMLKPKGKIDILFKILNIFFYIYIFSNIFTSNFKISTVAFVITAVFLSLLFLITFKEKTKG